MTTFQDTIAGALRHHQAGDLASAERLYREILQAHPRHAEALRLLAVLCDQAGRTDEAIDLLKRAVTVAPAGALPPYTLAKVLIGADRLEEAVEALQQTLAADPSFADALADLALVLEKLDRLEEAVSAWRDVINLRAGRVDDLMSFCAVLCRAGRHSEAIEHLERITQKAPDLAAGWCNLGAALRAIGRRREAVTALQRAIVLDDNLVAAHTNLACTWTELNDVRQAMVAARKALAIAPEHPQAHRAAAEVLVQSGELEMAERQLRIALQLEPRSPGALVELGDVLRDRGCLGQAGAVYAQAEALAPNSVSAGIGRVKVRSMLGESDGALVMADAALARFPDATAAVIAAAEARLSLRRFDEAATLLAAHLERGDLLPAERRMTLFLHGDALDRLGRYDQAWRAYEQANGLKDAAFDHDAFAGYVQSIIDAFARTCLDAMPRAGSGVVRPVFIAGMPRSGTTLVEQILASHPDLSGGGEMGLMGRILGRSEPLTRVPVRYPACVELFTAEHVQALADFAHEEFAKTGGGSPCITEKTPSNFLFLGLIEKLFPDARIIWCLRDPLDTCLSCYFHDFSGAHPYAYDLADLGFYYRMHERLLAHWRETLSIPLLVVRYEDVVDDQEQMTRRLLAFCDLPWDQQCLAFHENARLVRTASAEQVRRPIYRTSMQRHARYAGHLAPLRRALAADDPAPHGGG